MRVLCPTCGDLVYLSAGFISRHTSTHGAIRDICIASGTLYKMESRGDD